MAGRLHERFPDDYEPCTRCRGTAEIDCRACDGKGTVFGIDRYLYAGTIGRRVGLKVCGTCHGRGKQTCGICLSGSVLRT